MKPRRALGRRLHETFLLTESLHRRHVPERGDRLAPNRLSLPDRS
jgi:hypothetical protein